MSRATKQLTFTSSQAIEDAAEKVANDVKKDVNAHSAARETKAEKSGASGRRAVNPQADVAALALRGGIFSSEEEYERVTNSVVARIRSGEIQPCEPDSEE